MARTKSRPLDSYSFVDQPYNPKYKRLSPVKFALMKWDGQNLWKHKLERRKSLSRVNQLLENEILAIRSQIVDQKTTRKTRNQTKSSANIVEQNKQSSSVSQYRMTTRSSLHTLDQK